MRKLISLAILVLLLILASVLRTYAQDISLPREVAEYYYEQKKENDQRKDIIQDQNKLIDHSVKKIDIQLKLIKEKDLEIQARKRIEQILETSRGFLKEELVLERKKTKLWKATTGLVVILSTIITIL